MNNNDDVRSDIYADGNGAKFHLGLYAIKMKHDVACAQKARCALLPLRAKSAPYANVRKKRAAVLSQKAHKNEKRGAQWRGNVKNAPG